MKKSILFVSLITLFCKSLFSQVNLVPNHSFEQSTNCPNFSGQLNFLNDWNNVNLVYGNFNYGTPDYYDICSSSSYSSLPNNIFATLDPFEGNALVGLVIYNHDIPQYREYISTELTTPLNPENTYIVKFHLTGGINQNYRFNSHNFGIVFSESPLNQNSYFLINETPQLEMNTFLNTDNWVEYMFTYTPDKSYSHITIGSFRSDADINPLDVTISSNKYSTVFIDEISIENIQSGIKENQNSNISVINAHHKLQILNPNNETIKNINICDIQGKILFSIEGTNKNSIEIDLPETLLSGLYFVSIFTLNSAVNQKFIITN